MSDTVRVLVVDEDRDVRDLTRTFLEREDERFDVETAASAAEAIEVVEAEPIDAVVCDYRMPGTDGVELAAELDSRGHDIPFVLFSAIDDATIEEAAENAGIDRVVRKGTGTAHYGEIASAIRESTEP